MLCMLIQPLLNLYGFYLSIPAIMRLWYYHHFLTYMDFSKSASLNCLKGSYTFFSWTPYGSNSALSASYEAIHCAWGCIWNLDRHWWTGQESFDKRFRWCERVTEPAQWGTFCWEFGSTWEVTSAGAWAGGHSTILGCAYAQDRKIGGGIPPDWGRSCYLRWRWSYEQVIFKGVKKCFSNHAVLHCNSKAKENESLSNTGFLL